MAVFAVYLREGQERSLKERPMRGDFWFPWKLAKTALKKSNGESSGGSSPIQMYRRTQTHFCTSPQNSKHQ